MKNVIAIAVVLFSGCATKGSMQLPLPNEYPARTLIAAKKFNVIDVSQKSSGEMVFTGFERERNESYQPTPPQMVKSMLETRVSVDGTGDLVEVLIVDAGTYIQIIGADRVPFLNAFSFGMMERSRSCKATVVIKNSTSNVRKEFEVINPPKVVNGLDDFLREVVKCQENLAAKITKEISFSLLKQ